MVRVIRWWNPGYLSSTPYLVILKGGLSAEDNKVDSSSKFERERNHWTIQTMLLPERLPKRPSHDGLRVD